MLMIPIMQYVMPSRNKQLKKLLHFYWEVCPKYDDNGKLKQEMILVVCVFFSLATSSRERTHPTLLPAMQSATIWLVSQILVDSIHLTPVYFYSNIQMNISVVRPCGSSRKSPET